MKVAHVLYFSNMDTSMVLLILGKNTDDETAIAAIEKKIKETELYDIDGEEYMRETGTTPEEFRSFAEDIWKNHYSIYLERYEGTYALELNVPIL